jgi:photosystem II stability/assembly factor-like uncharacterized protein
MMMIAAMVLSVISSASAQWRTEFSGLSTAQRALYEMSASDTRNCYAIAYDQTDFYNYINQVTATHDGGITWSAVTIDSLEHNSFTDIAASSARVVHVIGWNSVSGGGNVFRSMDGGASWSREAANAFTDPASFPDNILFFNPRDGVVFGDPTGGYFEIYTTSNGGNTWTRVPSTDIPAPMAPYEEGSPRQMDQYKNTVWAQTVVVNANGSTYGRILRSDDKGLHWYVKCPNITLAPTDARMRFRDENVGLYKNNGILYRTTDGGATWNPVNYSGTWFSCDFDNVPGRPGVWISTGGDTADSYLSANGLGSSISYDDGDTWHTLDTAVDHTCLNMVNSAFGFGGGITSGSGNDGAFVYSIANSNSYRVSNEVTGTAAISVSAFPNPSKSTFSLQVNSKDDQEVEVNIIDLQGRLVGSMLTPPNQNLVFGYDLVPGMYQLEVKQGATVKTMRVVKY